MGVFGLTPFAAMKTAKLAAETKTPSVASAPHTYLLIIPYKFFSYKTVQRSALLYGVTAIVIYACSRPTVQLYCYEHISFYIILRMV